MNPVISNRLIFILSLAGLGVAIYLTLAHLSVLSIVCTRAAGHGCEEVANDPTAKGFGIPALRAVPTAAFGVLMYAAMTTLAFLRAAGSPEGSQTLARLQLLLAASGVAVAGWLTYLEAYVIHAWCQWCVASAVIILLIFIIALAEFAGSRGGRRLAAGEAARMEEA